MKQLVGGSDVEFDNMSNSTTDIVELCNVVEFYDFPNWTAIINRFAQKVARNNFSM